MAAIEKTAHPKSWVFDEDGAELEGRFLRIEEAPTRGYGYQPVVVLDVDGSERSVWLLWDALRGAFSEEVHRRGELEPGERIHICRGEQKTSEAGRGYRDFKVRFPDAPRRSQAEILGALAGRQGATADNENNGATTGQESTATAGNGSGPTDDIPF